MVAQEATGVKAQALAYYFPDCEAVLVSLAHFRRSWTVHSPRLRCWARSCLTNFLEDKEAVVGSLILSASCGSFDAKRPWWDRFASL